MAHAEVEERQLLKAMTWWDGFVVALANPGFLIAALGGSLGALGTAGAFVLWTISIILGSLQNNIHAELAAMFPDFTIETFPERHHFDPPHRVEPEHLANSLLALWQRAEQ